METTDSNHGTNSIAEIEALDQSRRHILVAVATTSTLWMLPEILRGVFGDTLPQVFNNVLILAGVIGSLAFMVFMFRFHRFQMRVLGDPELRQRLDDERVLELRREAIYRGWIILVIALAICVAVAPFTELPDQAVLLTLMLFGVNSPIVWFLILDRG